MAPAVVDRVHDFGHAGTLRLPRESGDHEGDPYRSNGRHQDQAWPPWARWCEDTTVVNKRELAQKENIVQEGDQLAKENGRGASDNADADCEQCQHIEAERRHTAILTRINLIEGATDSAGTQQTGRPRKQSGRDIPRAYEWQRPNPLRARASRSCNGVQ